jgi:hypothetical protein
MKRHGSIRPVKTSSPSVNFGCGFLFGAVAGASYFIYASDAKPAIVVGIVVGIVAALLGERFWDGTARFIAWLSWW